VLAMKKPEMSKAPKMPAMKKYTGNVKGKFSMPKPDKGEGGPLESAEKVSRAKKGM
jgi:hypothetical protein